MADDSDYNRMLKLGTWLDKYINNLNTYNFQELAHEAISLVDVFVYDTRLGTEDPYLAPFGMKSFDSQADDPLISVCKTVISKLSKPLSLYKPIEISDTAKQIIFGMDISPLVQKTILEDVEHSLNFPLYIRRYVTEQKAAEEASWEWILANMDNSAYQLDMGQIIVDQYNNIRERLLIAFDMFVLRKEMLFPTNEIEWIRLPALIAYIFVEFLKKRGSDYASLCANCDRFIIAERKGRRKFCSGKCRIAAKRERDREA